MELTADTRLNVTRVQIIERGLVGRCPNCGNRSLFPPKSLRIREACPACDLVFDPGGGFWLAPWIINYCVSVICVVSPIVVLGVREILSLPVAIALAVILGGFAVPLLLYRLSWSWWLMVYYFFFPHRLPENFANGQRPAK
jgi:uncharacterized protein (DUF983 family)